VAAAEPLLRLGSLRRGQMPQALARQRGLAQALELQLRSRAQPVLAMVRVMLMRLPEQAMVLVMQTSPALLLAQAPA